MLAIHMMMLLLVQISAGTWWSNSLRLLETLQRMWQGQDTQWCQWAIITKAHILYYACS